MTILKTRSPFKRSCKAALMATAVLMAAPVTIEIAATPAWANPGDEINWRGSNRPARKTYYRSEVTGSIIPLYYTDPPYDPSDSSMRLVGGKVIRSLNKNENKQFQVLDEINFRAQQQSDDWGIVKELQGLENSMWNRGAIEFGAVVTQAGTIAKEQRKYVFDALINRAKAQARMVAIGDVLEKMKNQNVLTRAGKKYYLDLISDQQREIEIAEDTLKRLDETQAKAFMIDVISLGTARIGSYVSQAIVKRRAIAAVTEQVLAKQTAVQTAREAEKQAAVRAANTALNQAERQAIASAAKVSGAQEAARTATNSARQLGTRAVQSEAALAARQVEARAAETALTEASKEVGRTRVASAAAKAGAESAEATLRAAQAEAKAAEQALASAKAKLVTAGTQQEVASARTAVQKAQSRAATARAAVQTARTEARTATAKAATASADAAAARSHLAKAKAADGAARTAVETAKTEASQATAAAARAQTAANQATDRLLREAAKHNQELANVAAKLAQQQLVTNQAVRSASANLARASSRFATANGQLASAGSPAARARAAQAAAAAQQELEAATKKIVELQTRLANLEQEAARLQTATTFGKWLKQLITPTITETNLINRFWGALFDLTNVITDNQVSSYQPFLDMFGPHLPDILEQAGKLYTQLNSKERKVIDEAMADAPDDVKAFHEKLKSGVAPVGSATGGKADIGPIGSGTGVAPVGSVTGVAPVDSSQAGGSGNGANGSADKDSTVPDVPTDLQPEPKPDKPATGTEPKPGRTPRWIGMGPSSNGANGGTTAIAMGGSGFVFATSIPEISFEITPAPVEEDAPSYAMLSPAQAAISMETSYMVVPDTDDSKQDRGEYLAAIQAVRGNLPPQAFGAVSQPYGFGEPDPSIDVVRDVQDRYREVEAHMPRNERDYAIATEQPAIVEDSGELQAVTEAPEVEQPVENPLPVNRPMLSIPANNSPAAGPVETSTSMPTPAVSTPNTMPSYASETPAGIGGTYRLQDTSSGVRQITIASGPNDTLTVRGLGGTIILQRDGNGYIGEGATLFGKGGHLIRVVRTGQGLRLEAQHPSGGSFATALLK